MCCAADNAICAETLKVKEALLSLAPSLALCPQVASEMLKACQQQAAQAPPSKHLVAATRRISMLCQRWDPVQVTPSMLVPHENFPKHVPTLQITTGNQSRCVGARVTTIVEKAVV